MLRSCFMLRRHRALAAHLQVQVRWQRCTPWSPVLLHYRVEPTEEGLKRDLDRARHAIVELLPNEIRVLIERRFECNTRAETRAKVDEIVDVIVERSPRVVGLNTDWSGERAWCWLCRAGSSGPYEQGFAIPEGLRRHLKGSYNAQHCIVMEQVEALLRDYFDSRFLQKEEDEWRDRQARLAERRKTEVVFRTGFGRPPELLDETTWKHTRTAEQLLEAENRLLELGFVRSQSGNVVVYTTEGPDYVVYADPRELGTIQFVVYAKPLPKRETTTPKRQACFSLPDTWKRDLLAKYRRKLDSAMLTWRRVPSGRTGT